MASTTVLVHWERKKVKDVLFGRAGVFFLVEEGWLPGYEVQLLSERILSRSTGSTSILIGSDPSSKVKVCALSGIDVGEFRQLIGVDASSVETPTLLGTTFITPPDVVKSMKTIPVVNGDVEDAYSKFIVRHNLVQFGVITSADTMEAATLPEQELFRRLYKVNDDNPFESAVIQLGKLVQQSLWLSGVLPSRIPQDGLMCDLTMSALKTAMSELNEVEFAKSFVCQPEHVSVMFSRVVAAWNALSVVFADGMILPEDPFIDAERFRSAIIEFQKLHKLARTGSLDPGTRHRLAAECASILHSSKDRMAGGIWSETNDLASLASRTTNPQLRQFFGHGAFEDEEESLAESKKHMGREVGRILKKGVHGLSKTGDAVTYGVKKGLKVAMLPAHIITSRSDSHSKSFGPGTPNWVPDVINMDGTTDKIMGEDVVYSPLELVRSASGYSEADVVRGRQVQPLPNIIPLQKRGRSLDARYDRERLRRESMKGSRILDAEVEKPKLEKRRSLSQIESGVVTEFTGLKMHMSDQAYELLKNVIDRERYLDSVIHQLEDILSEYNKRIRVAEKIVDEKQTKTQELEPRVQNAMTSYAHLLTLTRQCDSSNERLRYELADLEERLRDLDIAGREFDAKVEDLEELMPASEVGNNAMGGIMGTVYRFLGY